MSIYRVTIANILPAELAEAGQSAGLSGSVFPSLGFGSWGLEPGAVAELAGLPRAELEQFTRALLEARNEAAAYVTSEGRAWLLWADGRPDEAL